MNPSRIASLLLQTASSDVRFAAGRNKLLIRGAQLLRAGLLRTGLDPACEVRVRGIGSSLRVPLSHRMPAYRFRNPRYDAVPEDLAAYIRRTRGCLRMIDVGANVGDTILSTAPRPGDWFLAIEPHPVFFPYLVENMRGIDGVACLQVACGEGEGTVGLDMPCGGTAAPRSDRPATFQVRVRTLDDIWKEELDGRDVNFLKIDTDGFDVAVLNGATRLLCRQKPWVFYECDVRMTQDGMERHLGAMRLFQDAGYQHMLVFDNVGRFVASIPTTDREALQQILDTQKPDGPVQYHDLLATPEVSGFQESLVPGAMP